MHHRLVTPVAGLALVACAFAPPGGIHAQVEPSRATALQVVSDVMVLRRGALGDTLPYDACSIHQQTGRSTDFPAGLLPGVIPLLDRTDADPCARETAGESRFPRFVRVDSVGISDSAAAVYLSVYRGEWRYEEAYHFAALENGRGWGFRESRMTHPLRITARPAAPQRPR
jgi:hypothetical protein